MLEDCRGWVVNLFYCLCGCRDLKEVDVLVKGSWVRSWSGQYLTAKEPSWEQDGLSPIFNIM